MKETEIETMVEIFNFKKQELEKQYDKIQYYISENKFKEAREISNIYIDNAMSIYNLQNKISSKLYVAVDKKLDVKMKKLKYKDIEFEELDKDYNRKNIVYLIDMLNEKLACNLLLTNENQKNYKFCQQMVNDYLHLLGC